MLATLRVPAFLLIGSVALTGCAGGSDNFFSSFSGGDNQVTTSSVAATAAPKMDPACPSLSAQIDTLRREGVAEKVEKAAAKKYKMTPTDLTKADQLNKASAEFQNKCSTLPRAASAPVAPAPVAAATPAAQQVKAAAVGATKAQ